MGVEVSVFHLFLFLTRRRNVSHIDEKIILFLGTDDDDQIEIVQC